MKNKIEIQLSVLVFLLSFMVGCEETTAVINTNKNNQVVHTGPIHKSAGSANLKSSQVAPVLASMSFTAKIPVSSGTQVVPSLLEYRGEALLEGRLSFESVMTSTCDGFGKRNTTQTCPITAQAVYPFHCSHADIQGRAGVAQFSCKQATVNGRTYHIKGELGYGTTANHNYTIIYVEICEGPGAPPTCGEAGYFNRSSLINY